MEINGFSAQNALVNVLKTASVSAQSRNAALLTNQSNQENLLIGLIEKSDPDTADDLRKEQSQVESIIKQLQASKVDLEDRIKQAAAAKLARIKAELAILRLTAGGDPEATARKAARLAKELSAAVADYANAGSETTEATDQSNKDITSANKAVTAPQDGQETLSGEANAGATQPQDNAEVSNPSAAPTDAEKSANAKTGLQQTVETQIADAERKAAEKNAEAAFLREAKRILDELKSIIKTAKKQLEAQGETPPNSDIEQAENSIQETTNTLSQITSASVSVSTSVTVNISV